MEPNRTNHQNRGTPGPDENRDREEMGGSSAALSPPDPLWNVAEVANCLGITAKGVYGLVEKRKVPFLRIGSRLRFEPGKIQDWIHQQRVEATEC